MPFTIDDFSDLIQILEERPDWLRNVRRVVLTDELLALPEQLMVLRVRTEQRFQEFIEAQKRTEGHLVALAEAQKRTDERLGELAEVQKRIEGQVADLADTVRTLADGVGHLKGESLESHYRTKGLAAFSRILRRTHVLSQDELRTLIEEAIERGSLTEEQGEDIYEADVVVQGRLKPTGTEAYLVVEVSWGVGPDDVTRATHRAALLAQLGVVAIPVVAGSWITPEAGVLARRNRTWQLTAGHAIAPEPPAA